MSARGLLKRKIRKLPENVFGTDRLRCCRENQITQSREDAKEDERLFCLLIFNAIGAEFL